MEKEWGAWWSQGWRDSEGGPEGGRGAEAEGQGESRGLRPAGVGESGGRG